MTMTASRSQFAGMVLGSVLLVGTPQAADRPTANVAPAEGELVVYAAWIDRAPVSDGELDRLRRLAEDALRSGDLVFEDIEEPSIASVAEALRSVNPLAEGTREVLDRFEDAPACFAPRR